MRPSSSSLSEAKPERTRKSLCLETKPNIVKLHGSGEGGNSIACLLDMNQFIVSILIKHANEMKKTAETAITTMAKEHH